jgi:hypothetical protein
MARTRKAETLQRLRRHSGDDPAAAVLTAHARKQAPAADAPRCPKCARVGKATGAQQFRKVGGMKRLHAHMTDSAGHEWWDRTPAARKLGREEDARRKAAASQPHAHGFQTEDGS